MAVTVGGRTPESHKPWGVSAATGDLDPFDLRQPGRCALRVEPCVDPLWADGGNTPAAARPECSPQLVLADGMRAASVRSDVTETEHVHVSPTTRHGGKALNVRSSLLAVERVEQTAIEHRVKHSAQAVEVHGVASHELSGYAASRGLLPGDRQCGLSHIGAQNGQPQRGDMKGVLARAAPCVENRACECAHARQAQYRRLWPADVPRRRTVEV